MPFAEDVGGKSRDGVVIRDGQRRVNLCHKGRDTKRKRICDARSGVRSGSLFSLDVGQCSKRCGVLHSRQFVSTSAFCASDE